MSDYSNTHWMKDLPDTPKSEIICIGCSICRPYMENKLGPQKDMSSYQPETIAIPTLEVQNIVNALEAGLEHSQTVLAEHDASLGRTTRKNQSWAETLEKDITLLRTRITFLKGKLIGATTHYP